MFFTPELLERRESGFGLLWLAATLGAKSSFKKLPKRSVLTADIAQLCDLIAEPPEPLALRLSSNLMIGVARVYKVKQEIFYSDVTTCYNTLKKAVADLHTASLGAAELQAAQASLRPDVLTLAVDPGAAFAIDFGNIFGDWEDIRPPGRAGSDEEDSDDEFDPKTKKAKGKQKAREKPPSFVSENVRANLHTLDEHHEHLLSQSFDASFGGTGFGAPMPASQMEGGLAFSDDVFGLHDGMDLGDIGDELARELGEGWGAPVDPLGGDDLFATGQLDAGLGMDFEFEGAQSFGAGPNTDSTPSVRPQARENGEGIQPDGSIIVPLMPFSPIQGEDVEMQPNPDDPLQAEAPTKPQKKAKRVRLLLDARTELTDEELKAARANYMEGQETIRQELVHKKFEKESGKIMEELIWGVPSGMQAPVLVDFWMQNFKLQVEARAASMQDTQPPHKRRRIAHEEFQDGNALDEGFGAPPDADFGVNADMGFMMDNNEPAGFGGDYNSRMRSSEEPGVARRVSRPPSLIGSQFEMPGVGLGFTSGSQRSALFPWDNAGASSSVGGPLEFGQDGSARRSLGRADTRLRGSSLSSRHGSPMLGGRVPESPADFGGRSALSGEGFEFELPGEESMANESQLSDMNTLTLERNSHNFLEYAKMQLKTFPSATSTLTFDDVVPKQTSTPHVAAAAFYHCLVLATKNLVGVAQEAPYGTLSITVK